MFKSYYKLWPKLPFPPLEPTTGIVRHMTDIIVNVLMNNDKTHQTLATSIAKGHFPLVITAAVHPAVQGLIDPLPE